MALSVPDIIKFVEEWRSKNGFADDVKLNDNQIATFVSELHAQIEQMDFSVKEGTTIVRYSGFSNGKAAWEIAQEVSEITGKNAIYISNLPAGTLIGIYRDDFISAKLMGETKGANSNLIVFVPEGVDQSKVFATTELDRIFANKTFNTINGIPKGKLQAIYL